MRCFSVLHHWGQCMRAPRWGSPLDSAEGVVWVGTHFRAAVPTSFSQHPQFETVLQRIAVKSKCRPLSRPPVPLFPPPSSLHSRLSAASSSPSLPLFSSLPCNLDGGSRPLSRALPRLPPWFTLPPAHRSASVAPAPRVLALCGPALRLLRLEDGRGLVRDGASVVEGRGREEGV